MSCSELNRWAKTRILPSRMLTTTFPFATSYKARQFSPAKARTVRPSILTTFCGTECSLHLRKRDRVLAGLARAAPGPCGVTQACYIKTANQGSVRALESLDAVLCPSRALESAKPQTMQLQ